MSKKNVMNQRLLFMIISMQGLGIVILDIMLFLYIRDLYIEAALTNQSGISILVFTIFLMNFLGFLILKILLFHKNEISSLSKINQVKSEKIRSLEEELNNLYSEKQPIDIDNYFITTMEINVIKELCMQPTLTNKEIGSNLYIKTGTVKQYMNNIFKKLHINSRYELIDRCQWKFIG